MTAYEIKIFPNGQASLQNAKVGEAMHSSIGPWEEAHSLYVGQSQLAQRLTLEKDSSPLVLYDVGMGIAANALAALDCFLGLQASRPLHLISFESDLKGIEFALQNSTDFPFLEKRKSQVEALLKEGEICGNSESGSSFSWKLISGDFRQQVDKAPAPEIIFYDFYSPKSCPDLWGYEIFKKIYGKTIPLQHQGLATTLYTYTSSTAARAALVSSGFYIGEGASTSGKRETTVASTRLEDLQKPLGLSWLRHWKRSSKPLPLDYPCIRS